MLYPMNVKQGNETCLIEIFEEESESELHHCQIDGDDGVRRVLGCHVVEALGKVNVLQYEEYTEYT